MANPSASITTIRTTVDDQVADRLAEYTNQLQPDLPESEDLLTGIRHMLTGGKRLRPVFFWAGHAVATDLTDLAPDHTAALGTLGAALEFFHVAALLHDDVMDRSDTRRGAPAMHRTMAEVFTSRDWVGDADQFGIASAILAGDLCLAWSEAAFATGVRQLTAAGATSPAAATAGRELFDTMRSQLMVGQYLDMAAQAAGPTNNTIAGALRVIEHKSARYTVTFPLTIGATLAGADADTVAALGRYGTDVGLAFQLRDDLLGVFGEEAVTGKPSGDDLREGKQTVLLACASQALAADAWQTLCDHIGDPQLEADDVQRIQDQLKACGAVETVEDMIADHANQAVGHLAAIDGLPGNTKELLSELVSKATNRST